MTDKKAKQIPDEKQIDLTEARQKRCYPVIKEILRMLVDKNLLYNDVQYVEAMVLQHMQALFQHIIIDIEQEVFKTISTSLQMSLDKAIEMRMGKDKDELTLKDIDDVLTKRVS